MRAATRDTIERRDGNITDLVCRYVRERLDDGQTLEQASEAVLLRLSAEQLLVPFLRKHGAALVMLVWREQQALFATNRGRPPGSTSKSTPKTSSTPGKRVVDLGQLDAPAARLEQLYEVEGRWIRLGDMTKMLCRDAAAVAARNMVLFDRLANVLDEGETVRQRFDETRLEALLQEIAS